MIDQIHIVYDLETGAFYSKRVRSGLESYTAISPTHFNEVVREIGAREARRQRLATKAEEFLHGKWDRQEIMETGAPPYAATPARSGQGHCPVF